MKKIEVIIRPSVFDKVKDALREAGVGGLNYMEIKGFGRQMGHMEIYRGKSINVDFVPKVRFEVIVNDEECDKIVDVIINSARTGKVGDGKIFVSNVIDVVRIRTGERGPEAV